MPCPCGERCERCGREMPDMMVREVKVRIGNKQVKICLTLCPLCRGAARSEADRIAPATLRRLHENHLRHRGQLGDTDAGDLTPAAEPLSADIYELAKPGRDRRLR